jgi:S1-C subfamily serine protease
VRCGEIVERFSVDESDTDLVRIGTRPEDRDVGRRRDDLLDIPVGTERLVQQLVKASQRVYEVAKRASRGLRIESRSDISDEERGLLGAALFPFADPDARPTSPAVWANQIIGRITLPEISDRSAAPLRISLPLSRPRTTSPEEMASFYAPAVALIGGKDGKTGSGALISGDGLILTAAHVLSMEPFEVSFPRSRDGRRYSARVVFVNDAHDVALLRLTNYRSDRWFELGLSDPAIAGEAVVAMGNPAIGIAGAALGAISSGIVAKEYSASRSDEIAGVVADIAIASGSSGGPLVSRRTGRVIGVVTTVVSPSISKDFATSGYWAVAAPSTELGKWLGLSYSR